MQKSAVMAPPPPRTILEMKLPVVMMRDIMIKTMFRKNVTMVSELAKAICLPLQVTQELVDLARVTIKGDVNDPTRGIRDVHFSSFVIQ